MNRDRYLQRYFETPAVSFTDDVILVDASGKIGAANKPTDQQEVLAGLLDALHEGKSAIAPAALEALARCGVAIPTSYWTEQLQSRKIIASQAILSLGLSRTPQALEQLFSILLDEAAGRQLLGQRRVSIQLRQEAAYGLGVFAAQMDRAVLNRMVCDRLVDFLSQEVDAPIQVQVSIALALGITRPSQPEPMAEKLARILSEQSRPMQLRLQLPVTIAKLLADTAPENATHQEISLSFLRIHQNKRNEPSLRLSAIQALGLLVDARGIRINEIVRDLIVTAQKDSNRNLRHHSMMSLAYIGSRVGPKAPLVQKDILPFLIKTLRKGRKESSAWAALSIGVMGARGRENGYSKLPNSVGIDLLEAFMNEKSPSNRSALALGMALMEYKAASEPLHTSLHDSHQEDYLTNCCTALGMLGETSCRGDFMELISVGNAQVSLVRAAAESLAMLGGTGSVDPLSKVLAGDAQGGMPAQVAAAFALRNFPEKEAIEALSKSLLDPQTQVWVAREACLTLGIIASDRREMLRSRMASDLNTWTISPDLGGAEGILERL